MLDIKFIRENKEEIGKAAKNKNIDLDLDKLLEIDQERRGLLAELENFRAERNELAKINQGGKPSEDQIKKGKDLKSKISEIEEKLGQIEDEYQALMVKVPTI